MVLLLIFVQRNAELWRVTVRRFCTSLRLLAKYKSKSCACTLMAAKTDNSRDIIRVILVLGFKF